MTQFDKAMESGKLKNFLIVRHPFTRLVSAFRDKLERYHEKYYLEIGLPIMRKYREKAKQVLPESTFKTAIDIDGDEVKLPTWWEFVEYLVDNKDDIYKFDEHWRPISKLCQVCLHDYHYILHFEKLQEEQTAFGEIIGFDETIHK